MKVFLTGASSGLGAALARRYAARGATVGLVARRQAELTQIAAALAPATVAIYAADVRDAEAMARAGRDFVARFGVPDLVIGNAGISRGTLTDHAEDLPGFRTVLETNVLGLVHTFHPFVAPMRDARHGVLAGIASVAGFRGLPGSGAYCGSKAAAITYLESLRVELRPSGVDVLTICPGFIATPLTARNPYRMPFLMQPDDAARRIAGAIERRRAFCVVPWSMAIAARLLRALPRPLFDRMLQNRKRKPRDNPT
ncbi:MAG TPA: SDR family oxidoreductase [Casimicrobiaceae bacterium]|nr:SDR family oxidoreductase [Casimicrobiaceae bacterium]